MKLLPQASAMELHIGTIAGKLNGLIPAQRRTAPHDQLSMPRPTCSGIRPSADAGCRRRLDDLGAAGQLALASDNTLPCSR